MIEVELKYNTNTKMFSIKVFVKELCCGHLLFLRCIHLNQKKGLLELISFHGNNCRKMFNMKTGTENVDRLLMNIVKYKYIMYKYIYWSFRCY